MKGKGRKSFPPHPYFSADAQEE